MNEKINILERSSYTELVLCWGMVQIRLDLGQIWGGTGRVTSLDRMLRSIESF